MKFIENIYFDESQNKYIIDHSKGISTIDKANIKHIEYQYGYTNKYWISFPLVILLIILNFSYRNFSYPNFFDHKLAYTILILILLSALLLCIEFIVFFTSKFTIYHEKNETFYFNQLTSSFNFYGAFQSRNIKCENIRKNKKDNPNGFFQIFCLVVPTILFLGSYQSFLPKLTLHFVSDFKVINYLWLTSIIFVLLRFLNLTLTFIYTPILLLIGLLNVWEKKYTEIVYHEIFTFFNYFIEEKITLYSSMIIGFIYYSICFTLFEYPQIPFLILTVCLIFLLIHRFFYLKKINYSNEESVCLFYLNDTEVENQLILHRNYNALASITAGYLYPVYLFFKEYEHLHVFYNHKWLNEKFEMFQSTFDLKKFNLFFPDFINIQYFKKDYLFYLENVILKEKEELVIIPYFILDEEILFAFIQRDKTYLINDILDRFVYNNASSKLNKFNNLQKNNEVLKSNTLSDVKSQLELQNDKEVVLEAVKNYGYALESASKELQNDKEVVQEAVKSNGNSLQFASKELQSDKKVVLEAVKSTGNALKFASKELQSDKEVVLEAVKNYGYAIEYASKELQNDKQVILEAVKSDGEALYLASKELQNDKEVVLQAVKSFNSSYALVAASNELQNDKEVVLEAIKSDGALFHFASKELQNDRSFILDALKLNGAIFKFASIELQNNNDFIQDAIKSNGYILKYVSKNTPNYKEFALEAIKSYGYAIEYVSEEITEEIENSEEVLVYQSKKSIQSNENRNIGSISLSV